MSSESSGPPVEEVPICASSLGAGLLSVPLPALDDPEGDAIPEGLPPVIDAHVHLFPPPVFEAIWRWFETWGWPIRYQLQAAEVVDFLLDRGVEQLVALQYAHKPGMARSMNAWMAEFCATQPRVTGLATVFPGEEDAAGILEEAFDLGLGGVKFHCHVQCMSVDDPSMEAVYEVCARRQRPVVVHAGREPKSPGYRCDPHLLCSWERVERVLADHPDLRVCVPHLGADEFEPYEGLLERHAGLWLDTTMMLADYFDVPGASRLLDVAPERVMYGTDFPNLPYAWDREVSRLGAYRLSEDRLEALLGANARSFFSLGPPPC